MSSTGSPSRSRASLRSQYKAFRNCPQGRSRNPQHTPQITTVCYLVLSMIQQLASTCAWTLTFWTTILHRKEATGKIAVRTRANGASISHLQPTLRPTTCQSASKLAALIRAMGPKRAVALIHPPPPSYPRSPETLVPMALLTKTAVWKVWHRQATELQL